MKYRLLMCVEEGCKKKERCYRYSKAPKEYGQHYFTKDIRDPETGKCSFFVRILRKRKG